MIDKPPADDSIVLAPKSTPTKPHGDGERKHHSGEQGVSRGPGAGFVVRGVMDGHPSVAHWRNGTLDAEPELIRRAEIVVAMGETFWSEDDPSHVVMASLKGGGYDVMLTVMRAFTTVTSVELPVGDST